MPLKRDTHFLSLICPEIYPSTVWQCIVFCLRYKKQAQILWCIFKMIVFEPVCTIKHCFIIAKPRLHWKQIAVEIFSNCPSAPFNIFCNSTPPLPTQDEHTRTSFETAWGQGIFLFVELWKWQQTTKLRRQQFLRSKMYPYSLMIRINDI